ncbi:hypothetical protein DFH08DRAFT_972403 [Mycena albidolilacea]|uniref:Uncharacterized protein n=1 Tax=Mycena albidolilacea TaxID=1033008 RepID=A0AAD6ZBS2_9AGAR|nr:hypothetical protein DFH08DRAFT_972403 [Mycena albidolilacea]
MAQGVYVPLLLFHANTLPPRLRIEYVPGAPRGLQSKSSLTTDLATFQVSNRVWKHPPPRMVTTGERAGEVKLAVHIKKHSQIPSYILMTFLTLTSPIVALFLVYASPTRNGTSESEASAVPWMLQFEFFDLAYFMFQAVSAAKLGLPEKFVIPVTISNAATNGSSPTTTDYGVWSRYPVDTDTWVFNNRVTHKWLSIKTTNRLVTTEYLAPIVFAVDYASGPSIQLVIKMPNADQVLQEVHTGSCSHVELRPARGQNSQHWVYS